LRFYPTILFVLLILLNFNGFGQLSPGDLSEAHSHLEGLSNCTECHSIGNKVPNQKCLDCHTEIDNLLSQKRGYHSSTEIQEKLCVNCHNEHHGKKFDAVKFDDEKFDHDLTSYELEGEHNKIDCRKCHIPENIASLDLKERELTFLGMEKECLACHDDFHQETLAENCIDCHNIEAFRPAPKFDHDDAAFKLVGAHQNVECIDCHQKTNKNNREFQEFTGIEFNQCIDCHSDIHNGTFGSKCLDCHNNTSWKKLNANNTFNHDLTDYPLKGLHIDVDCKECHTSGKNTQPVKHNLCKDCHNDYHNGEFTSTNVLADCQDCHLLEKPFTYTLFGLKEHNDADFKLQGAHVATPCFSCHVGEDQWTFRNIGASCIDCHDNIHQNLISEQFYAEENCTACHASETWNLVSFDHAKTDWPLEGKHQESDCRDCHFDLDENKKLINQQFNTLKTECIECHDNIHGGQFINAGKKECTLCHTMSFTWNVNNFNHSKTKFPLEGKHKQVDCKECHKPELFDDKIEKVNYKIIKFECKDCHSS
tara:strand:+ start:2254 stop:3861 length:1608 start_codon:yes stop_codon:yes gene_type:complete